MKKRRLNLKLNKPVKMLTLVASPDSSLRPAGTELVPLGAVANLSPGRAERLARACTRQAVVFVRWIWGTSRRVADLGRATAKGLGYGASASPFQGARATAQVVQDGATNDQRFLIAASSSLEPVPQESDLRDEVRMLRAQVQTQNQILAELTRALLEEKHRVRESDQSNGHYDRKSESRLLHVLQANVGAEENWGNSESTSPHTTAD